MLKILTIDKQTRALTRAHARTRTHTHARTHAYLHPSRTICIFLFSRFLYLSVV